jgi:hypothetical protein
MKFCNHNGKFQAQLTLYSHVIVAVDGVWIGNWIYSALTDHDHK